MIIKNSNTRRKLYENRYVIFVIIFAIILFFSVVRELNTNIKNKTNEKTNSISNNTVNQTGISNYSNTTILTGQTVSDKIQTSSTQIIEDFINYCNNGEVFASSMQLFKEKYINRIFTTKKMVSMQNWINSYGYTYRVKILDDMISSGKITSSQDEIEDYYTIIQQNNEYKLSINGYIGKQNINKKIDLDGIIISIVSKNIYKEYEEYSIKIENGTENTILLDSQEKTDTIYLVGSNDCNYKAYSYELDKSALTVKANGTNTITIRFNKLYSNQTVINELVFNDIISNYDEYENLQNKTQYKNRLKASIEL
jgi:hypothetical protein